MTAPITCSQTPAAMYGQRKALGLGAVPRTIPSARAASFLHEKGRPEERRAAKLARDRAAQARRINGGWTMVETATRLEGDNFSPKNKFTPVTEQEAAKEFSAVILQFSVGELAHATGRSKDTVKCWKSGRAFPNGASLMALIAEFPRIEAWVRSKTGSAFQSPASLGEVFGLLERLMQSDTAEGRAMRARFLELSKGQP